MKTVTQDEVNKACRSRSFKEIDATLMKVRVELMLHQEYINELSTQGKRPIMSERYELNVLKLNQERLEKRVIELGKRAEISQKRKDEEKARLQMYIDLARSKMPMHQAIFDLQHPQVDPNAPIVSGDRIADENTNSIKAKALEAKAQGIEITPEWFSKASEAAKANDGSRFSVKDLVRKNETDVMLDTLSEEL